MKCINKKYLIVLSILIFVVTDLLSQPEIPVCAFLPFKNKSGFESKNWDIVNDIPNVLADSLFKSGKYQIVEQREINEYLRENKIRSYQYENLNVLNQITTALKIDYLIMGQINQFGLSRVNVGSFLVGGYESYQAEIEVNFFVYNHLDSTRTENYISASEIKRRDLGLKLIGKPSEHYVNFEELDKLEFNSPEFKRTIVGEALKELTGDFVYKFTELFSVASIKEHNSSSSISEAYSEATIVFMRNDEIYLNVGTQDKINVGEILNVYTKGEPISDPNSNQILGYADKLIGKIKILIVKDNHLSIAKILEQYEPIKVKDKVRIRQR